MLADRWLGKLPQMGELKFDLFRADPIAHELERFVQDMGGFYHDVRSFVDLWLVMG